MTTIPYLIHPTKLTVFINGKSNSILKTDLEKYNKALELINNNDQEALSKLFLTPENVSNKLGINITREGIVTYFNDEGKEEKLPSSLTKTIVAMFEQNEDSIAPLVKFWEKLRLNPSFRVNNCLFDFIEANNIVINEKGNLIMYKIVARTDDKEVFLDLYTHKIEQRFGKEVRMPRKDVDDNIERTCSYGYHVCTWTYLPHYGCAVTGKDAILLCEVDPQNIVAIPKDYNNSKIRTCAYTPLEEYTYDQGEINKVLYRNSDFEGDDKSSYTLDDDVTGNSFTLYDYDEDEDENDEFGLFDDEDEDDDYNED